MLFAPKHDVVPELHPTEAANAHVARTAAYRYAVEHGAEITLREGSSDLHSAIAAIDAHDLVIGDGTLLSLAVARGKPAVTTDCAMSAIFLPSFRRSTASNG